MRLRDRISQQLISRLDTHVPLPTGSDWAPANLLCVLEQLTISEATGIQDDWQQAAAFHGCLCTQLLASGASDLAMEPLLASLLAEPLQLAPAAGTPAGDLSETARAVLSEYRETLDQGQLTPVLSFQVSGCVVRKLAAASAIVEVHLGQAPDIGLAHLSDYQQVV